MIMLIWRTHGWWSKLMQSHNSQLCFNLACRVPYQLDRYIGQGNAQLVESLQSCIQACNSLAWYIFMSGAPQYGKTYLLKACCHDVIQQGRSPIYIDLSEHYRLSPDIFRGLDQVGLVCVDNIHAVIGNAAWEEALFDLYNRLAVNKTPLIISAHCISRQLQVGLKDLETRLSQGLEFVLEGLSDDELLLLMQEKARAKGYVLPEKIAFFILQHCERTLAMLLILLKKYLLPPSLLSRRSTCPLLKNS